MADVTGTIGNEYVELNNAATEATLKQLLQAVQGQKNVLSGFQQIAQKAGVSPEAAKKASEGLDNAGTRAKSFGDTIGRSATTISSAMAGFTSKVIEGTAQASDLFGVFSRLPGIVGLVAQGFQKAAEYQEKNLQAYQKMSSAGVNFAGELTAIRTAAADARMTLDSFAALMSTNSEAFARMGVTTNEGAKNFSSLSKAMMDSDIGRKLRAMGYTTDELNQGMINYINTTGGRSKAEMANTSELTKASQQYMYELDALAQTTGVTRKEQEQAQKEAAQQAAFQRKLAGLNEAERAKLQAAYDKAYASKIAGATDLVMAEALGMPAVTKAGQTLSGVAPEFAQGMRGMTQTAMRTGTTMADVDKDFQRSRLAAANSAKQFGQTGDALSLMGGDVGNVISSLIRTENQLDKQGIKSEGDAADQRRIALENQKKREQSQANSMVAMQDALEKLRKAFLGIITPLVEFLTPGLEVLANVINEYVLPAFDYIGSILRPAIEKITKNFKELDEKLDGKLLPTLGVLAAAIIGYSLFIKGKAAAGAAMDAAQKAKDVVTGNIPKPVSVAGVVNVFVTNWPMGGGGRGGGRGQGGRGGGAPAPGGGGRPVPPVPSGGAPVPSGGAPAAGGGARPVPPAPSLPTTSAPAAGTSAMSGVTGTGGGFQSAKFASVLGKMKGFAGLGALVGALEVINVAMSAGEYETKEQFAGALTGAIAGALGGAGGAMLGAAVGSFIFPGVGTLVGGVAGGLAGNYFADKAAKKLVNVILGDDTVPGLATGGIATAPTLAMVGEKGTEAIIPLDRFSEILGQINPPPNAMSGAGAASSVMQTSGGMNLESLVSEMNKLNSYSAEMLKYLKETADQMRKNVDATKSLNGDLFA